MSMGDTRQGNEFGSQDFFFFFTEGVRAWKIYIDMSAIVLARIAMLFILFKDMLNSS